MFSLQEKPLLRRPVHSCARSCAPAGAGIEIPTAPINNTHPRDMTSALLADLRLVADIAPMTTAPHLSRRLVARMGADRLSGARTGKRAFRSESKGEAGSHAGQRVRLCLEQASTMSRYWADSPSVRYEACRNAPGIPARIQGSMSPKPPPSGSVSRPSMPQRHLPGVTVGLRSDVPRGQVRARGMAEHRVDRGAYSDVIR